MDEQGCRAPGAEQALPAVREFVPGEQGRIEVITVSPAMADDRLPTLYFLVGWWGGASDYLEPMRRFAARGFRCRSFSWRGTGQSEGGSFWGLGYETDLLRVLDHFQDERMVLIPHSGATDYLRNALPRLNGQAQRIEAVIIIAPLARSGSMNALRRWLSPDATGTTLVRWTRFLGSNLLGVSWFMRNELALRRVLLADHVSKDVVQKVWSQIDACPFGRYFLSLWRFPNMLQPPRTPFEEFGITRSLLLHSEHDKNFTPAQQRATAEAFRAEFDILPGTCHQWFADPHSFQTASRKIVSWLAEKQVIPKECGRL